LLALGLLTGVQPLAAQDEEVSGPFGVVALVYTGINPYHVEFRDDSARAFAHPSTYLPGYPEDAQALELTLDAESYREAVREDCETWQAVEAGEVYWIPGTRIVGAVSFQTFGSPDRCDDARILDADGHGTMVASRAAASTYGACPECLIVSVQALSGDAVEWAGQQASWIDVQSNSWGPFPGWEPTGFGSGLVGNPEFAEQVETAAQTHPVFFASGNGIMAFAGVVGNPAYTQVELSPSVIAVGGHDSGYVQTWPTFPSHVVSDACDSWAAFEDSLDESAEDAGGGTSAASPFVAGGAVQILLEARALLGEDRTGVRDGVAAQGTPPADLTDGPLADGVFTSDEWREVLFKTATRRPEAQFEDGPRCELPGWHVYSATPVQWTEVPDEFPEYVQIGYGAVDRPAVDLAGQVLRGEAPLPDRSETDAFFELGHEVRSTMHQVYRLGG
jgi:hypothetical protein